MNAEFDALVAKILRFAEVFAAELPQVVATLGDRMEHALSGMLRGAFAAVYEPLRTQLETLDPAGLEADLDAQVYAPIRALLDSLSVEAILGEAQVTQKLGAARAGLDGVLDGIRELEETVGGAYDTAVQNVVAVSPATLQADLQNAYAPVAAALAGLDLGGLSTELEAELERLADQIGTVLEQVLAALEAMVAAIPDGIEGVDAQVDIRVGA